MHRCILTPGSSPAPLPHFTDAFVYCCVLLKAEAWRVALQLRTEMHSERVPISSASPNALLLWLHEASSHVSSRAIPAVSLSLYIYIYAIGFKNGAGFFDS